MIGTLVRRGCLCSKTSEITIRSGGEWLRLISTCVYEYEGKYSGAGLSKETKAPIIYTFLQARHLDQVHDLLTRAFWSGIDSTFSLDNPTRLSLIDSSKRLLALPTGTINGHSDLQTTRSRRRDPQVTSGNVHNLSSGEIRMG